LELLVEVVEEVLLLLVLVETVLMQLDLEMVEEEVAQRLDLGVVVMVELVRPESALSPHTSNDS
jgi:hypothetical protein